MSKLRSSRLFYAIIGISTLSFIYQQRWCFNYHHSYSSLKRENSRFFRPGESENVNGNLKQFIDANERCPLYAKPIRRTLTSIQQQRLNTMVQTCRRYKKDDCLRLPPIPNYNALFIDKYMIAVCEIQKCGSTSWRNAMFVLKNIFTVQDYLDNKTKGDEMFHLGNKLLKMSSVIASRNQLQQYWDQSIRILTVRDPFERLVSAYKNKFIPNAEGNTEYYQKKAKKIFKRYSFFRQNKTILPEEDSASFEDFVNSILSNIFEYSDSHWQKYNNTCNPCDHDYNYIIKFETLHEDIEYLVKYLNIPDDYKRAIFDKHHYVTHYEETKKYFQSIPKLSANNLYKQFQFDFEMFGYAKPDYL